jgi:CRISPR system Cascade subunit CasB
MTERGDRISEFVNSLLLLAREGHEDRAALAALRKGARAEPGWPPEMWKYVVDHLRDRENPEDRWYFVTAAMFGINPKHLKSMTIGNCFQQLVQKSKTDSLEKRFLALLNAHPDDLPQRLYRMTRRFKSEELGLDYYTLLRDLLNWDRADRRVQKRWARDFYRYANHGGEDHE